MGMKAYFSNRIYKNTLEQNYVEATGHVLLVFNQAKHYASSTSVKELRSKKNKRNDDSMHVHVKKRFDVNDYYANSSVQESNSLLKSQKELEKMYISNKQEQIKSVKNKIKTTKSRLTTFQKLKNSIIKGKVKIPGNIKNIQQHDSLFSVHFKKETFVFFNLYTFEHQYVDREIQKLKSRLGRLQFRLDRLEKQLKSLKNNIKNVVFGSKDLFKGQFTNKKYINNHEL